MMRNDATSEDALMGLAERDVTGERNERNTFVRFRDSLISLSFRFVLIGELDWKFGTVFLIII